MIYCPNCRKENDDTASFCRSCGNRLIVQQTQPLNAQTENYRRPYLWQTDEFQVEKEIPKTQQLNQAPQLPQPYNQPLPPNVRNPNYIAGYRCPKCGTQTMPYITRQISTAGWVTFAVLLVTTGIFFWIGLLMKEDVRVCPVCNYKYN